MSGGGALTEEQAAQFEEGVCLFLNGWDALQVAVYDRFGGYTDEAEELLDRFLGVIASEFDGGVPTPGALADVLATTMDEDFGVILQDRSDVHGAQLLVRMHGRIRQNIFDDLEDLRGIAERCVKRHLAAPPVVPRAQQDADGGSDEEDGDGEDSDDAARHIATGSAAAAAASSAPAGDADAMEGVSGGPAGGDAAADDGWTTVARGRGRRR